MRIFLIILVFSILQVQARILPIDSIPGGVHLIVLGNVQDAGSPQLLCQKNCCKSLFLHPDSMRKVVSLGVVDFNQKKQYLFDATPDLVSQLNRLNRFAGAVKVPDAGFLTHAHIGHYPGLMYFGKEALNAKEVPVYVMPRMKSFLENNGPWSQLVAIRNILLKDLNQDVAVRFSENLTVTPVLVPHRDEYSETVGFIISGPHKKALFIPDIDKWEKWNMDIISEIAKVDYAFLDATFFDSNEVNNRDISQIPHPFVIESIKRFERLPQEERGKIYFIHLNHTNPLLNVNSEQTKKILQLGFHIARTGQYFKL